MSPNMSFDVIIIGAGPAGITAAAGIAKQGLSVVVLEGAVYPGAENWSGCVYYTENLVRPEIFGEEVINNGPYERKVVKRGMFITDGITTASGECRQENIFKNIYIVLRPIFDRYLAKKAQELGAVIITETHAQCLLRHGRKIVGVNTERGPIYAKVVFLAEGDASSLVAKEGYETCNDPSFMQGIKLVLKLPEEELEKRFSLGKKQGVAYEFLLRNCNVSGRTVPLNISGFLYTNRDSISLGIIVSIKNLKKYFNGDHNSLIEWYRTLPVIKSLTKDAILTSYGAKLIRNGGWKEHPILIDEGLAIGGASTGLGIDIPYPNYTGPATYSGYIFSQAVRKILKKKGTFKIDELKDEYLIPLESSYYANNAKFLQNWPEYFDNSRMLFESYLDLPLEWLAIGLTDELNYFSRKIQKARLLGMLLPPLKLIKIKKDIFALLKAINIKNKGFKINIFLLIIKNTFSDLFHSILPAFDPNFKISVYSYDKEIEWEKLAIPLHIKLKRLHPKLAKAIAIIYENNSVPLDEKFFNIKKILYCFSLWDLFKIAYFGLFYIVLYFFTFLYDAFRFMVLKVPVNKILDNFIENYRNKVKKIGSLDIKSSDTIEEKLATITYLPASTSHIIFNWPKNVVNNKDIEKFPIWFSCPAQVYNFKNAFTGYPKIMIQYENCLKCETCWHSINSINWTRGGSHRLIYEVYSLSLEELELPDKIQNINNENLETREKKLNLPDPLIRTFSIIILHFNSACSNTKYSLLNSTRAEWFKKLFNWIEILFNNYEKQNIGLDSANSDLIILVIELQNRLNRLKSHLEQNKFLWVRDGLIAIYQDIQGKKSPILYLQDYNETDKLENIIRQKLNTVFNIQSIKNFENKQKLTDEELLLFKDMLKESSNELVSILSEYDFTLAYIYILNCKAKKIITSYMIPNENFEEEIIVPVVCKKMQITIIQDKVIINGKSDFFPVSLQNHLLLILNGYLMLIKAEDVAYEYNNTIGAKGGKFVRLNLKNMEFPLSKLKSITSKHKEEIKLLIELKSIEILNIVKGAGKYLLDKSKEHAYTRIQFPGEMRDASGEEGTIKFGIIKRYISEMETHLYVLSAVTNYLTDKKNNEKWINNLCGIIAIQAFGPAEGSFGYNAGQICGGIGYSEDDLYAKFYRDSSFFRFLVGPESRLLRELGIEIVKNKENFIKELNIENSMSLNPLFKEFLEKYLMAVNEFINFTENSDFYNSFVQAKFFIELFKVKMVMLKAYYELNAGLPSEKSIKILEGIILNLSIKIDSIYKEYNLSNKLIEIGKKVINDYTEEIYPDLDNKKSYQQITEYVHNYNSGQLFVKSVDLFRPMFSPEILFNEPNLKAHWNKIKDLINKQISENRNFPEGIPYERYLEKIHAIPDEDIKFLKQEGFFSTIVPVQYGGKGWSKCYYFILCWLASRYGDPSLAITIMANTSIGTTPVIIGLKEDLEKLSHELDLVLKNSAYFGDILSKIKKLIIELEHPDPDKIKKHFQEIWKLIGERISHTQSLKYLAKNFLMDFFYAGQAGEHRDLAGFSSHLNGAYEKLKNIDIDIKEMQAEIPRRRKAYELFYKMLSGGQISAFALTEPTAGSDSGGISTVGKLKKKKVYPDKNGRWYFYLDEEKKNDIRYLIETDCLSWRAGQITYLYDNSSKYSPIYFNEYDYSTDDPAKLRYYIAEQEKMYFHDIAQIKKIQDEYFFEYYELSGTKMWITNARIAGQFSLFAKTDEGITGFIVDRHSEGLIVGKDEIKMGQLGSCTNEIALNKVRVPRENIIGIAGHGQVIALETLNSGRTGLAAAATAIMNKILSLSKEKLLNSEKAEVEEKNDEIKVNKIDDLQFLNLGHIFIKVLMSESLVFDLISLWDSPSTKSVRMESAISKYFCSELLHEVLYFAEDFFGLEGQTDIYLIEKIRRDARILNIYEGTNEVQRFLVLKDLIRVINEKAFDSEEKIYPVPDYIKNFIKKIKVLKMHLYEYVKKAFELMGDSIASNVTWQPVFFPLVELAGIIVVMESTVRRLWLIESNITNSDKFKELMATALEQVLVFLNQKFELFENKYLSSFNLAKEGVTPPEIAIAEIYSIDEKIEKTFRYMPSDKSFIQILCIVRPTKRLAPFPRIKNGKIAEPDTIIEPSDLGAVVSSLQLKNRLKDKIKITVLTIGQKKYESLLKVLLAGGVDNAVRIDIIDFPSEAIETADIIYKYIKSLPISFNVILSGKDSSLNGQKFLPVLAYKLNYFYFSDILKFNLNNIDENNFILYSKIAMLEFVTNKNNICIELDSDNNNILYTLDNYLEVLGKENIKVISENSAVSLNQIIYEEEKKEKKIIKKKELLSISEIAGISMDLIGRKKITHGEIFNEDLKILPSSFNPEEILFISDLTLTAINQDYVDFALHYADQLNKKLGIILLCYNNEQFKNYLNELKEKGISNVYIIEIPSVLASPYSKGKILELFLESSKHNFNTIISGDKSSILMYNLASNLSKIQSHKKVEIWQSITDVQYDITENKIIIKFKTFDGKLRSKIEIGNELYKFMILEKNVNLYKTENKDEKKNLSVYLTKPEYKFETEAQENIEKYYHKILKALKPELKNAEIIVDLGYGIKNNEGLLLAQSLKDKLQEISGKTVFLGATRKVTQDLKLLPVSYQIGQTGVKVNPKIIFTLGISGAPQHIDYIGKDAIIIAFNQDQEAPIIKLSKEKTGFTIYPIIGDLFETVKEFMKILV